MFDVARAKALLAGTEFAGLLHFQPETDSTNNDAMKAARAGARHGAAFVADAQTAGRGRGDHRWHSAAGVGLYVSVVLRPRIEEKHWMLLPFCAGLAAIAAMAEVAGVQADLRWPNDLLMGGRKACGILVESGRDERGAKFAVAGIGINVHQRDFAPDMATPATSLELEAGRSIEREALLACLLKSLQQELDQLAKTEATPSFLARVESSSTWVRARRVEVHGPQACSGVTAGLDEHGFLLVDTGAGRVTVQTGGIRAAEVD